MCACDKGSEVRGCGKKREIREIGSEMNISRIGHLVHDHRHRWRCTAPDTDPPRLTDGGQRGVTLAIPQTSSQEESEGYSIESARTERPSETPLAKRPRTDLSGV